MRFLPALAVLLALPAGAQTTWFVDASAAGPGTGTVSDPYTSIQQAIDALITLSDDTIQIASGLYVESLDLGGKSLRLEGAPGSMPVLQRAAANRHLTLDSGEGPGTEFVRIEFAFTPGVPRVDYGGAVYAISAVARFEDCHFRSIGSCFRGGAVFQFDSDLTFEGCSFTGCYSLVGGALRVSRGSATVRDCVFEDNLTAACDGSGGGGGAAVALDSFNIFHMEDSVLRRNRGTGPGGAIQVRTTSGTTIERCIFEDNSSPAGVPGGPVQGAAIQGDSLTVVSECEFRRNIGGRGGAVIGGIYTGCLFEDNVGGRGGAAFSATLRSCTLVGNQAIDSGAGAAEDCSLWKCVLCGNASETGAGACENSSLRRSTVVGNYGDQHHAALLGCTVENSIVWDNISAFPPGQTTQSEACNVTLSILPGVPGSLPGPPLLFGRHVGDMRLLPGSPAIDAGSPSLPLDPDGTVADLGPFPFDSAARGGPSRFCDPKRTSAGCEPFATMIGAPSRTGPPAQVLVDGVPEGALGLLLGSADASPMSFFGSTLCVGGTIRRNSIRSAIPGSGCGDLLLLPVDMGLLPVAAGELVFLQVWFRDPAQPDGTAAGLSDAIVATVQP